MGTDLRLIITTTVPLLTTFPGVAAAITLNDLEPKKHLKSELRRNHCR